MKTQKESVETSDNTILMKIAGGSAPGRITGAAVRYMQEGKTVVLSAIGAGSVNQACKAIISIRKIMAGHGKDVLVRVGWADEEVKGSHRSVMRFHFVM